MTEPKGSDAVQLDSGPRLADGHNRCSSWIMRKIHCTFFANHIHDHSFEGASLTRIRTRLRAVAAGEADADAVAQEISNEMLAMIGDLHSRANDAFEAERIPVGGDETLRLAAECVRTAYLNGHDLVKPMAMLGSALTVDEARQAAVAVPFPTALKDGDVLIGPSGIRRIQALPKLSPCHEPTIAAVVAWLRGKQRHTGWTIRNLVHDLESGAWRGNAE